MSRPLAKRTGIWSRAPDILLIQLFEHGARAALHDIDDGLPFAVRVSHVCKYWRFVATATSSVWTCVPVHPLRSGLTEFFLERAGAHLPLDLCFHLKSERNADATLALVLSQDERIRELYLRAQGNPAVFLFISRLRYMSLPRLAHFEINLTKNPKGGALGHLPSILNGDPPATLESVALRGVCFEYHSPMLKGLTSLTLADLPRRMAAPSYTTFRDLLTASPNLIHLKLDNVFPVLASEIDYGEIEMPHLRILELAMARDWTYIPDFFAILSVPRIDTFSLESSRQSTWEGFENALSILEATFASVRTLRLSVAGEAAFQKTGARLKLFNVFPKLQYLSLAAHYDKTIQHYLRPWIAVMQGLLDGFQQEPKAVWPELQLLTIRAPFDTNEDEEDGIDDSLEFLGSIRLSMNLPFEVWQECISVD